VYGSRIYVLPLNGAKFRLYIISSFEIRVVVFRRIAGWMTITFWRKFGL